MSYNGWTNHETWAVALWIDNEPYTHDQRCKIIDGALDNIAEEDFADPDTLKGAVEAEVYEVAKRLKDWIEDENPLLDHTSLYLDLLTSALGEVDWPAIAETWLTDAAEELKRDQVAA